MLSRSLRTFRPQSLTSSLNLTRPLSTTPALRIKEDANRTPEQLEQEKQEHLKKQRQGKGEWDESLASSGEASVKADREEVKDTDKHIEELQEKTAGKK